MKKEIPVADSVVKQISDINDQILNLTAAGNVIVSVARACLDVPKEYVFDMQKRCFRSKDTP